LQAFDAEGCRFAHRRVGARIGWCSGASPKLIRQPGYKLRPQTNKMSNNVTPRIAPVDRGPGGGGASSLSGLCCAPWWRLVA
jgi:hypothetical protein